jgi:hypothetical protein
MTKLYAGAVLVSLLLACGSDPPPGANLGIDKTLEDSPLARLQNASLLRAGDAFTLAGYDATNASVRWGRVSLDGTLTQEAGFAMAPPVVGPVFAATGKNAPGDQLVVLSFVASSTVATGYDLLATVHTAGAVAPAAPVALATLPAGTDPAKISLIAGAAASGDLGFVAWGIRVSGIPVSYLTLPADALTAAAPAKFLDDSEPARVPAWDCLAAQSSPTGGFSFGAVTPGERPDESDFNVLRVDENAVRSGDMTYQLTVRVKDCQIVGSPNPSGSYFMAFQGSSSGGTAIDFATYYPPVDPTQEGTVTTQDPVMPAAQFGDPLNLPAPAWVTSAGSDVVIGLTRKAGPRVYRFRYDAVPHGSALHLRTANGNTGPVSAWVGPDAVYATYADQVKSGSSTLTQRYFVRVDSPASLP